MGVVVVVVVVFTHNWSMAHRVIYS